MPAPSATFPAPHRSTFVTVIAWLFIVLGGLAAGIQILMTRSLAHTLPEKGVPLTAVVPGHADMPAFLQPTYLGLYLFYALFFVVSFLTLFAAIGLLRRRNWARLTFIGVMVFGIVCQVLSFALTCLTPPDPVLMGQNPQIHQIQLITSGVITLLYAGFFAWIIIRLLSAGTIAEFHPPGRHDASRILGA